MKVVVTAQGADLDAVSSPVFGRCPCLVFVETDTMSAKGSGNPGVTAGGGAGIQAAQFVVNQGAQAVLTHNVGPKAMDVLQSAAVRVYRIDGGTVREAVRAFVEGRLPSLTAPSVEAHAGMRGGSRA